MLLLTNTQLSEFGNMQPYLELEKTYSLNVYAKRNVTLVRGENARVWDDRGNEYLDCISGNGVSNLGHANEKVVAAVARQAARMITCSNLFYNDERALLCKKLVDITPANLKRVFLCNSGAESIEAAIKFSRFVTKRTDFIATEKAFHGRTFGALSATYKPDYRDGFGPLVPGFRFVPFNDFEKLKQAVTPKTAGIILEIIQGEGGIHPGSAEYFHNVRKLCDDRGILFIADEIQSGFCRTGKMFACEYYDLQPDMLCLAKALAGGLPMGAVMCSDKIELAVGKHGTTFGGNPLACAAANATIDFMIENKLDQQACEKGDYFRKRLQPENLSKVVEVRGPGLMIGIEVKEDARPLILQLMEIGLLVFPAGNSVVRVFPPLTISYPDLDQVIAKLQQVLK
jgi:acetylornithine/LysW-gamma-L-lysine aminotransferase